VATDWTVSDPDGDLDAVTVELRDGTGAVLESTTASVAGTSASGTTEQRTRGTPTTVALTVTDAAGATTTETTSL
jgi:subtilisin